MKDGIFFALWNSAKSAESQQRKKQKAETIPRRALDLVTGKQEF